MNHFSKGEPPRAISLIAKDPVLGNRRMVIPIGAHQYKHWYDPLVRMTGINLYTLSTDDTVQYVEDHPQKRKKYEAILEPRRRIALLNRYLTAGVEALSEGGNVLLFLQGGRRPFLEGETEAVEALMRKASHEKVERFAFMFIGAGIPGVLDYGDKSVIGNNWGREYEFTIGETSTAVEFILEA